MTTFIALLRGINVGGNRRILMGDLRTIFGDGGCEQVTTYIQSGNVVFTHPARTAAKLGADLEARIKAATGFDVPVVLRTAKELAAVVDANPFPDADPNHLHIAFLTAEPPAGAASRIDTAGFAPEELAVVGREAYLHLPNGLGRSKLPAALNALKVPATIRNWRTVTKLVDLSAG